MKKTRVTTRPRLSLAPPRVAMTVEPRSGREKQDRSRRKRILFYQSKRSAWAVNEIGGAGEATPDAPAGCGDHPPWAEPGASATGVFAPPVPDAPGSPFYWLLTS